MKNEISVDYGTLVEVMKEELSNNLNQIIALKAQMRVLDKTLSETLERVAELEKQPKSTSRKKSVNTGTDAGSF